MAWLPDGERYLYFVLAQLTNVTDRQTDRHSVPAIAAKKSHCFLRYGKINVTLSRNMNVICSHYCLTSDVASSQWSLAMKWGHSHSLVVHPTTSISSQCHFGDSQTVLYRLLSGDRVSFAVWANASVGRFHLYLLNSHHFTIVLQPTDIILFCQLTGQK